MPRSILALALLLGLAAPAMAFETPGLDRAVATYRLDALSELENQLGSGITAYQRAEILASRALILSADEKPAEAKQAALAAVEALKASLAAKESVIASQFLLFKLYGQLTASDWTFAMRTREPLQYMQQHAPQDRRTRVAEGMAWLFTPRIFGGNAAKGVERLEALYAEGPDPEVANLLALAYQQTGKREKAREVLAEILARNPQDRSARQLMERLR